MATTVRIHRQHDLDRDQVRNEVQQLADELARKLSAQYRWQGDRLLFERSGANGHIEIGDADIDVEIRLGFLLYAFKNEIQSSIEEYLDQRLG